MSDPEDQEKMYYRKVVRRFVADDGTEHVTYDCGHMAIWVVAPSPDEAYCSQCVHDLLDAGRID